MEQQPPTTQPSSPNMFIDLLEWLFTLIPRYLFGSLKPQNQ